MLDGNVVKLIQPELLRDGARVRLTQAVEAETLEFLPRPPEKRNNQVRDRK